MSSRGYSATVEHCTNRPISSVQRSNRKLCSSSSSSSSNSSSKIWSFLKIFLGTFENATPGFHRFMCAHMSIAIILYVKAVWQLGNSIETGKGPPPPHRPHFPNRVPLDKICPDCCNAGDAGKSALESKGLSSSSAAENSSVGGIERKSTRLWAEQIDYDTTKLFNKAPWFVIVFSLFLSVFNHLMTHSVPVHYVRAVVFVWRLQVKMLRTVMCRVVYYTLVRLVAFFPGQPG